MGGRWGGVGGWEVGRGGWVGGGEGWVGERWGGAGRGEGVGREEEKTPQVKTRGHQSPSYGPDHSTRLKGHHSGRG